MRRYNRLRSREELGWNRSCQSAVFILVSFVSRSDGPGLPAPDRPGSSFGVERRRLGNEKVASERQPISEWIKGRKLLFFQEETGGMA